MGTTSEKKGPKLAGEINEATVQLNGINTRALLDTGSCVSLISKGFYDNNLSNMEIKPLAKILNIECADGNSLPYLGYIEGDLTVLEGMPPSQPVSYIFLVTPDTAYSAQTPVLIGMNVLEELLTDCKATHGDRYLQVAKLTTPWYLAFRTITVREKELKRNKDRVANSPECGNIPKSPLGQMKAKIFTGILTERSTTNQLALSYKNVKIHRYQFVLI